MMRRRKKEHSRSHNIARLEIFFFFSSASARRADLLIHSRAVQFIKSNIIRSFAPSVSLLFEEASDSLRLIVDRFRRPGADSRRGPPMQFRSNTIVWAAENGVLFARMKSNQRAAATFTHKNANAGAREPKESEFDLMRESLRSPSIRRSRTVDKLRECVLNGRDVGIFSHHKGSREERKRKETAK